MLSLTSRTAVVSLSSSAVREGAVLFDVVESLDSDGAVWDIAGRETVQDTCLLG